jgi:NAD(P)-dependent dehydrogenase (short-subunit alcohol dehydrogenase family)/putative sterol carrier protein
MAANTGKLAGRTVFITGGSRGIGEAIGLKCAKDGANIVIAAKTAEPHPKLPGTIYTAAAAMEAAGGKALACVVDIQSEDQVKAAVQQAVDKFGGIDILVNNASAIHPTNTISTPMKRYDLMMNINTRGTFLCSKYIAPHLKQGTNPHILNISPPLNMAARWFKDHVAYSMAKYGMSMCALGMAEEFKEDGIAVNTLWPRTAIYTAAMAMLAGGDDVKARCRSVDIMADAAYVILTKDSKSFNGNFCVDDEVLAGVGITDLERYSFVPGANLLPDFFLDVSVHDELGSMAKGRFQPGGIDSQEESTASGPASTFQTVQTMLSEDLVKSIGGVFAFDLKDGGTWYLDLKNGSGATGKGAPPSGNADVTMTLSPDNFVDMFAGKLNATTAFMSGKLKIKGDLGLAMKLDKLMKQMTKSKL